MTPSLSAAAIFLETNFSERPPARRSRASERWLQCWPACFQETLGTDTGDTPLGTDTGDRHSNLFTISQEKGLVGTGERKGDAPSFVLAPRRALQPYDLFVWL
jgi:hypothetical protein